MSSSGIHRRDFLKTLGLGSLALSGGLSATKVLGKTSNGIMVENQQAYGNFPVEILSKDEFPYTYDENILRNMEQRMNVFSRNEWDPIRFEEIKKTLDTQGGKSVFEINMDVHGGKAPNQTRLDYAFMQAAWSTAFTDSFYDWESKSPPIKQLESYGKWNPQDLGMNWAEVTQALKHAALFYGASLAGTTLLNPLWIYDEYKYDSTTTESFDTESNIASKPIPRNVKYAISLAFEEDYDGISNSPGRIASAATGDGYSRMAVTAYKVAEFIRALGYTAIPSGNGVGLSIPVAIDAGLGELGRNGILITPKFGPRVRLAKVYTDMPLIPDSPIRFGVKEFCDECKICADECPSGSISKDEQSWKGDSVSNNDGTLKWYVKPETCFDYNGFSCSNCKRTCPFNKPNNSWLHQLIRENIDLKVRPLNNMMVYFDQASGYGQQSQSTDFWKKDGLASIPSREAKD